MEIRANLKGQDAVQLSAQLSVLGTAVTEALSLAAFVHEGTFRKEFRPGVTYVDPYVSHPIRNALRGVRFTQDYMHPSDVQRLAITCLLHDTVEDGPERIIDFYADSDAATTRGVGAGFGGFEGIEVINGSTRTLALDVISDRFGVVVKDTVSRVTNPVLPEGLDKDAKDAAYLEHLRREVVVDEDAFLTKAMDLIDNAGSLKQMPDTPRRARLAAKYVNPVTTMVAHADIVLHRIVRETVSERLAQVGAELTGMLHR